ncbi:extracellular serine/threonine protein kinase FAM20C-like [Plectropomus leopardus]|uniref:extracellular serine/threonine protein kinase FAM20C-like n=1 Tax=Plectropomus leopardus TaxID=160734 RepID=UPI001C4CFCB8|nr:extracellular serine/threonine protein kinase FAM20C-like [Plectropomus leopardus]XP_042360877.1 extracellular serine/threonine protein kinase FAM20C-like [Plectropomus leopardus]
MIRLNLGRSTRSVCLGLACLSLALNLLLAIFCLSVLQTPCVLPTSSSSSIPRTNTQHRQSISHSSSSSDVSSSHKLPTILQNEERHKLNANTNKGKDSVSDAAKRKKKLIGAEKLKVKGPSKLEALFEHPLYNVPHPELQDDDWLLRVKKNGKDTGSEGEEREDVIDSDSQWQSASEEEGYDKVSWTSDVETHPPWLRFHLGISRWELYNRKDPNLAQLTHYLATQRVLGAVQKTGGTQLKLLLSFPNYGQALLKPMKQSRDAETDENLFYFSDFERHNAEIAAFHLDRLLGFNRIPPVVGRLINVTSEIREITTDHRLSRTFFTSPVGNVCFHGQCEYYCSTEHPLCGRPHALEVSLAAMLPDLTLAPRRSWRSPWRRSYSRTKQAQWEKDPAYCDTVKQTPPYNHGTRLVDLIDMTILDFLMSNMDRHHYEVFEKFGNETFLLHLDNGRAFGRHSRDEPSILVPLKQCCRIRRSTLLRLRLLSLPGFRLSDVMRESLSQDPLAAVAPLLSEPHLSALDRRLATVLQVVQTCQDQHKDVIYNDLDGHDQQPD